MHLTLDYPEIIIAPYSQEWNILYIQENIRHVIVARNVITSVPCN